MKFGLIVILMAALSASADTNVLTSRSWRVTGTMDAGPNPREINVAVDKLPAGVFSELKVYFNFGETNLQQVFSLKGQGTIQPIVPPPLVPGGAFRLSSYRDCELGLTETMGITDLQFRTSRGLNAPLRVKGRLSNFDSLVATDLKMKFYAPETNAVVVDIRYKLTATRDLCVDHTLFREEDEFRIAQMGANFMSPATNQNSRLRYTRIQETICDPYSGCHISRETFCADLDNTIGYLLGKPRLLGDPTVLLLHTNAVPRNTPTLGIDFRTPPHGRMKTQAFLVPTINPAEANVTVWGNWVKARKKPYSAGKTVTKVRVLLWARDPNNPGCDQIKVPVTGP